MEWDQKLFHKVYHFFRKRQPTAEEAAREARGCSFAQVEERLVRLAKVLTGAPIQVHRAEAEGGGQGDVFFLPVRCDLFSTPDMNELMYLFRICFLATQRRWAGSFVGVPTLPSSRDFRVEFTDYLLAKMYRSLPNAEQYFSPLLQEANALEGTCDIRAHLYGHHINASVLTGPSHITTPNERREDEESEDENEEDAPLTVREAPPKEEIESLQVEQDEIDSYTLMHQFEKVETLDEFNGRWRDMDGDDTLDQDAEALEELDLRQTVRSDVPAHSVYQADYIANTSIPESQDADVVGAYLTYPEWDRKKHAYKPDFCKVFPQQYDRQDPGYVARVMGEHRGTYVEMRRRLARLRCEREQVHMQRQGDALDLDALVGAFADRMAGRTPDERVYLSTRPRRRELSVLILMDMSLSTDAYTDNQRILDVEKAAILLFGQLLHEEKESFQVDAFCSRTRNHCHYITLKSFGDAWPSAAPTIAGVQPAGYTRIGPALRHATSLLSAQKARHKWILFLSDGKPNDYDRYEGKYGIHDVRQAIREAHEEQIHIYALAIEDSAKHSLPQLFGRANFQILPKPSMLPEALLYFYTRLLR